MRAPDGDAAPPPRHPEEVPLEISDSLNVDQDEERVVHIDRSNGGKLGVDIDDSDGVSLVIKRLGPGLIDDWNRTCARADVRVDDRIVQVNDIRDNADCMFAECMKPQALILRLQRVQVPAPVACPTDSSEVIVHVYDLWGSRYRWPRLLNAGSTRFGVFHTGVEVYGREWYFGATTDPQAPGVYCMPQPKEHPVHRYCRSLRMGPTQLAREDLEELIPMIRERWLGGHYHPWRRNCHHFTHFFCQVLGFPSGPGFGLLAPGDRRLALQGAPGHCRCFPCSGRAKQASRGSPPLLLDEAGGAARCQEPVPIGGG